MTTLLKIYYKFFLKAEDSIKTEERK